MSEFIGQTLVDHSGGDLGRITDVISNPIDLKPEWLVVKVGRLGGEHLVPFQTVESSEGHVSATVTKDQVKTAPKVPNHNELDRGTRDALYRHYGLSGRFRRWEVGGTVRAWDPRVPGDPCPKGDGWGPLRVRQPLGERVAGSRYTPSGVDRRGVAPPRCHSPGT